jgi:hypothetical protein
MSGITFLKMLAGMLCLYQLLIETKQQMTYAVYVLFEEFEFSILTEGLMCCL